MSTGATDTVPGGISSTETLSLPGSLTGCLETNGDQDWYGVTMTAGQTVNFTLTGYGTLTDTVVTVYDATGGILAQNDDRAADGFSEVTFSAPTAGTYFVGVSSYLDQESGEFELTADSHLVAGDTSTSASIAVGGTVSGTINAVGDQDWYRVSLTLGQAVTFDMVGAGVSPIGDTYLALYDASGAFLHANDDFSAADNSQLTFVAPTAGDYFIAASGYAGAKGDFDLSITAGAVYSDVVPDTVSTGQDLTFGVPFAGTFDYGTDDDWYRITTTGDLHKIDLLVRETGTTGHPVTVTLYDTYGFTQLDTATSRNMDEATLSLQVATQGTYFVSVSYAGSTPGDATTYDLLATEHAQDLADTVQMQAAQTIDDSDPIRVYIATEGETVDGITADEASAYEQQRIMAAFAKWSEVADIEFVQTATRAQADIEVVLGDVPPFGSAALPGSITPQIMGLSNRVPQWTDPGALEEGGFGFLITIHEIGHLIGLAHTHASFSGAIVMPGVTEAFGDYGDNDLNQEVYSVMSYNRGWKTGPLGPLSDDDSPEFGSAQGPGAIDIAAVQRKYGANLTTGAGNTLYTLQAMNGGYESIWDVSGTDEIRHLGSSKAVIDLRAATLEFAPGGGGYISYLPEFHGGFTIANGVVIENAWGGDGNDTITGNATNNLLTGERGDDSILGLDGADTLIGNRGNDTLDGGAGMDSLIGGLGDDVLVGGIGAEFLDGSPGDSDTLDYSGAVGAVTVGLWNNTASGDPVAAGDTILNFENVTGGGGGDNITGNHLDNVLIGNNGDDTLNGSSGHDTLIAGDGADSLTGGFGDDLLVAGIGAEYLDGSPGDRDTLDYSGAAGAVTVRLWNNTVSGDPVAAGDMIVNFENITGGSGNDFLVGTPLDNALTGNGGDDRMIGAAGDDTLTGGADNDNLQGGAGLDLLIGGTGRDYLTGGDDADVFVFASTEEAGIGADRDQIMDFQIGLDLINVSDMVPGLFTFRGTAGFSPSFDAELRLFETPSGSTIVQFDVSGNGGIDAEIRVANVTGLTAADFLL